MNVLSPLDDRYKKQLTEITALFCEQNLMSLRLTIEIEWFKTLIPKNLLQELPNIELDMQRIKELELSTNHDIKALEYFLKEKLSLNSKLKPYIELVHFCCTSDDINNLSYALMFKQARDTVLTIILHNLISKLKHLAHSYAETSILAHTHGQAATPTTIGKEFANFTYRITKQYNKLQNTPILGKFNGAVGNFNAHLIADPEKDWTEISKKFIEQLGLEYNPYTTQIEPHDWLIEHCNILTLINNILIGLCKDIWHYISIGYFKQKINPGEVGSSTMPHKVNPIDFENAEGNLGLANALLNHFANKLPISRLQRDLTDSTVMRNLGVAIGHSVLAYKSILKGLDKLEVDNLIVEQDLNNHWEILTEAIQTIMRKHNIQAPYEQLKNLSRGQKLNKNILHDFINTLAIPESDKQLLLNLTPQNYIGKAADLAKQLL